MLPSPLASYGGLAEGVTWRGVTWRGVVRYGRGGGFDAGEDGGELVRGKLRLVLCGVTDSYDRC